MGGVDRAMCMAKMIRLKLQKGTAQKVNSGALCTSRVRILSMCMANAIQIYKLLQPCFPFDNDDEISWDKLYEESKRSDHRERNNDGLEECGEADEVGEIEADEDVECLPDLMSRSFGAKSLVAFQRAINKQGSWKRLLGCSIRTRRASGILEANVPSRGSSGYGFKNEMRY